MKSISQKLDLGEIHSDDKMVMRVITQKELEKKLENMYVLIATSDLGLPDLLEKALQKTIPKLISFENFLKQNNFQMLRFDYDPPFHGTFVVQPFRAIKKVDEWIIKETEERNIVTQNRFTNEEIKIPIKSLVRGLRRPSRTNKFDITEILDYLLISPFGNANRMIKNVNVLKEWKNYVKPRLAHILLSRRLDISAVGTSAIAFYSSIPTVGAHMWSIKGADDECAKVITLWLNSTLNLLSMLVNRTETRGAWMVIHSYAIGKCLVLNSEMLTRDERETLLNLFIKSHSCSFSSILEQLRTAFAPRVEIDKAILKILGFNDDEINQLLDYLYPALANEIEQLKTLMEG